MAIKIISPNQGAKLKLENAIKIEGTADSNIIFVKLSSPVGNQDFPLGVAGVSNGKWSLSYQFTMGGERKIVAEGFDASNEEVDEDEVKITLDSIEDDSTSLVTIASPNKGENLDLEKPVNFEGTFSGDITKISLRTPFGGKTFGLGDASISGNNWSLSREFNTGGDRQVVVDGIDSSGKVLASAIVSFNLNSTFDDDDDLLRVKGAHKTTKAFRKKVIEVAKRIKANPLFLMAVMSFESAETFSPSIKSFAGSGATGLIQFLPSTARGLGTTVDKLARMSAVEQLDWVEKYFKQFRGPFKTLEDTYMAVLFPRAIRKGSDFVLFSKPSRAYRQNSGLDLNGDGKVTAREAASKVRDKIV